MMKEGKLRMLIALSFAAVSVYLALPMLTLQNFPHIDGREFAALALLMLAHSIAKERKAS